MYVPRAMYSFNISFWMVPRSLSGLMLFFSADTIYNANRVAAVAFIVMEVDTLSSGIWLNNRSISRMEETGTPTFPTSPSAIE